MDANRFDPITKRVASRRKRPAPRPIGTVQRAFLNRFAALSG